MGLIPIEVKSGFKTNVKQLKQLNNFIDTHQCHYGILINNSEEAVWLNSQIIQLPAGCL